MISSIAMTNSLIPKSILALPSLLATRDVTIPLCVIPSSLAPCALGHHASYPMSFCLNLGANYHVMRSARRFELDFLNARASISRAIRLVGMYPVPK